MSESDRNLTGCRLLTRMSRLLGTAIYELSPVLGSRGPISS